MMIGANEREETFILWINGLNFSDLDQYVEESEDEHEVARSLVEKTESNKKM